MKIAVVGSRTIIDRSLVVEGLLKVMETYGHPDDSIVIISGGAKGVDTLAHEVARENKYDFILFKPYHMIDPSIGYSPKFFFSRNKQIADNADVVLILWDGQSNGTKHMLEYCKKRKKPFILYTV